jgi:prepilin-type N-terminal cleavage/methylation domain-containing protein
VLEICKRRRGFTLIEMLVVVAIIAILAAFLLPTLAAVRQKAKIKATRTLIDGIAAGMERYFIDFDEYPPSSDAATTPPGVPAEDGAIYKYLCGADGKGLIKKVGTVETHIDPYVNIPVENVRKGSGGIMYVVDAWGNHVIFRNCRVYYENQRAGNPNYKPVPSNDSHNPTSFDMWSFGPDKKASADPHKDLEDDIANWVSEKKQE